MNDAPARQNELRDYILKALGTVLPTGGPAGEKFLLSIFPISSEIKTHVWLVATFFAFVSSFSASTMIHRVIGPYVAAGLLAFVLLLFGLMYYLSTADAPAFSPHADGFILGMAYVAIFMIVGVLVGAGVRNL